MATQKQIQSRKNVLSILFTIITIAVTVIAYKNEDNLFLSNLGSLTYGAPIAFWCGLMAIRINWDSFILGAIKFAILAITPIVGYSVIVTSMPNEDVEKNGLRVATYNMLRFNNENLEDKITMLERVNADILVLLEINSDFEENIEALDYLYPHSYKTPKTHANGTTGASVILSAYPITESTLLDDGFATLHKITYSGETDLSILHTHPLPPISSNLMERRNKTLDTVANTEMGENKIILGDFNTVEWHSPIKNIVEAQGVRVASKGMLTWPVPLPMAGIDHILTSYNLPSENKGKVCLTTSDHCLIYVDINMNDK